MSISRRQFLHSSALLSSVLGIPHPQIDAPFGRSANPDIGVVAGADYVGYFRTPSTSERISSYPYGYTGEIYETVRGEPYSDTLPSVYWHRTDEGYAHSSYFVRCRERVNLPVASIPLGYIGDNRMLGMITVAKAYRYTRPTVTSWSMGWPYILFFGQVHWFTETAYDERGRVWYRLQDDYELGLESWVPSQFVQPITDDEFSPIAPGEEKWLVIDRRRQIIEAYQGEFAAGNIVLSAPCRTGGILADPAGGYRDFTTPRGVYFVEGKAPSRRMVGWDTVNYPYDLPGVPWTTYFVSSGIAIHGVWWHRNFGVPGSHGCVNVHPAIAKWLFRWTEPYCPPGLFYLNNPDPGRGTPVEVI